MKHENIHETPDVSYIHNEGVAHEASDVNVGAIAKFTVGLLILTLFTMLLMWLFKGALESQIAARASDKEPPMAMKEEELRQYDMGPRLQGAPGFSVTTSDGEKHNLELREPQAEYRYLLADWQRNLEMGQKEAGTDKQLTLPIGEAKKKLLESGTLKSSADATHETYDKLEEMPSSSSAGRMTEKRIQ